MDQINSLWLHTGAVSLLTSCDSLPHVGKCQVTAYRVSKSPGAEYDQVCLDDHTSCITDITVFNMLPRIIARDQAPLQNQKPDPNKSDFLAKSEHQSPEASHHKIKTTVLTSLTYFQHLKTRKKTENYHKKSGCKEVVEEIPAGMLKDVHAQLIRQYIHSSHVKVRPVTRQLGFLRARWPTKKTSGIKVNRLTRPTKPKSASSDHIRLIFSKKKWVESKHIKHKTKQPSRKNWSQPQVSCVFFCCSRVIYFRPAYALPTPCLRRCGVFLHGDYLSWFACACLRLPVVFCLRGLRVLLLWAFCWS